jgi:long-chain acyl-CoA synthetase
MITLGALDPAGEHVAVHAAREPDKTAVVLHPAGHTRTYRQIDETSLRLAAALRSRGVGVGDHVALMLVNQLEFYDVFWAVHRLGCFITPINWHLKADEAGYIVSDCGASILFASGRLADVVAEMGDHLAGVTTGISVAGDIPGFEPLEELCGGDEVPDLPAQRDGAWMFYSSGTTGRPKGILPLLPEGKPGARSHQTDLLRLYSFDADTVFMSPAPLYHAAPAGWTTGTQALGGTSIVMERFDPLELLAAIERYRVTHLQLVPTHMVRLLKLDEEARARFDLSSLQVVTHAAAPCPVDVKQAILDWLGPIVHEFYGGSEGVGFCYIGPEEWLAHPGSVGKSLLGPIHVLGEDGRELPVGEEGEIWFEGGRAFEYYRDPEMTKTVWNDRGWSTLGDIGRVDAEGYLYLTDRAANMIISGGVNIYPRETEDVLVMHPAVADVAVIGTPDPDMGEQVTAFVQLLPGASAEEDELIAWCRGRLSHYKCPRAVRFVSSLPRLPTGKLLKRLLPRDPA